MMASTIKPSRALRLTVVLVMLATGISLTMFAQEARAKEKQGTVKTRDRPYDPDNIRTWVSGRLTADIAAVDGQKTHVSFQINTRRKFKRLKVQVLYGWGGNYKHQTWTLRNSRKGRLFKRSLSPTVECGKWCDQSAGVTLYVFLPGDPVPLVEIRRLIKIS